MASLGWNIYIWNTNTLTWDSDGTIDRPNEGLPLETVHNQQKFQLADGDSAFVTPEVTYLKQPIQMVFYYKDESFVTQLVDYLENNNYIKIETHVSGRNFIGRFTSVKPNWLTGENPDKYDVESIFEIMETY
jgi:hypothetical protein